MNKQYCTTQCVSFSNYNKSTRTSFQSNFKCLLLNSSSFVHHINFPWIIILLNGKNIIKSKILRKICLLFLSYVHSLCTKNKDNIERQSFFIHGNIINSILNVWMKDEENQHNLTKLLQWLQWSSRNDMNVKNI